ncbi:MAG: hypothetical protein HY302_02000 [Opitutae bacterium]|nr:hypothetical protein [Opitutae bacterium]
MPTIAEPAEAPWEAGLHSARAMAGPGLALIAVAVAAVLAYYYHPPTHAALEQLTEFRQRGGFAFSGVTFMLFGGVLPFLILRLTPATAAKHPWPQLAFFALFWAWKGVEIDLLYRLQAVVFGAENTWPVVLKKMLADQLVYNPLYAAPYGVLLYAWKDAGFRWATPLADLRAGRWYARRILPVMFAVWGVWIPTVCCVYALPLALQLPLASVMNCLWAVLFSQMTLRQNRRG